MASAWNKLVKKVFLKNRKTNKNFKLGDAMKMASAMRKNGGDAGMDKLSGAKLSGAKLSGGKNNKTNKRSNKTQKRR